MEVTSLPAFAVKQNSSPAILRAIPQNTYTFPSKKSILSPKPSAEVIAKVFPEKELPTPLVVDVFPQAVDSKPRRKEDIIGFNDVEQSDTDESIDIIDIKSNVKFLPATVEGLAERFNQLSKEYKQHGKHEHRNELVFLLDEL